MKMEGISTLFIHVFYGLLVTRLDHFLSFDSVLVVWALKVFLKISL